ncbi:CdaR family protein [Virgibacillus proomii]|uniref:CdaR family protein n=1 Tax=Virgibacillus proomii TaxID=84407 RepID=UPI001C126C8D|nr:CdaR family protein [Virgibacillus proomii]MBU5267895.1 hypothetical protein [Virgibacillus proomii]
MDNWFRSKWFVRVVSLAFAVFFYVFVTVDQADKLPDNNDATFSSEDETQNLETLDDVPVNIKIDDEKYVVSGVPEYVSVSLEGSASILKPTIRNRNFEVFVDLRDLGAGEHTVELQHNLSNKLDAYIEPKRIDVVIEEKATKEFNVTVDFLNEDQMVKGFELGDYEVHPKTVTITSAKSVIDKIGIVKAYVDVSGLDAPIDNREVPVNVYDSQGNELRVNVKPENVVISADVSNFSKKVPVSVETSGNLPDGFELNSISANVEEVEVFGSKSALQNLKEIRTEAIDLSKITNSGTIETNLAIPEGVSVAGGKKVEVTVELAQPRQTSQETNQEPSQETSQETTQTRTIANIPIEIEGIGDGLEAFFKEPANGGMNITVSENRSVVAGLKKDDFKASINVTGLKAGTHDVPISVDAPDGVTVKPEFKQATIEINES